MQLNVKGYIDKVGATAFDRGMFNAGIISEGKLIGEGAVDENGKYSFTVEAEVLPDTMELILYPASVKALEAGTMAIRHPVSTSKIVALKKKNQYELGINVSLPRYYLEGIIKRAQKYHVHGKVYVEHPTYFETLAGCRIDFYEVDSIKDSLNPHSGIIGMIKRDDYLGSAYTDAGGDYSFKFSFGLLWKKPETIIARSDEFSPVKPGTITSLSKFDFKPDIRARFYQFINGSWTKIYDAPMTDFDWNIDKDFHRDYILPEENIMPVGSTGSVPASGFRFHTIGLLPVDNIRIVNGYAFAQPGDPCGTFTCHPFCHTLRIYGLFAAVHAVSDYEVELLKTDASGTALAGETWQPLPEPLNNLKWNDVTRRWNSIVLGPTAGRFQNVDILPESDWLEHALKVIWNTANCVDGFYKLRITGFNAANTQVAQQEMPMVRIDNSMPEAYIDVIDPTATICGDLALAASRQITFSVTAYHSQGHIDYFTISGTRGRYGESAGSSVTVNRPDSNTTWSGVTDEPVVFPIAVRSSTTILCVTMAYGFHLRVQGTGTNGYGIGHEYKRLWAHTNLIVTEPS